MSIAEIKDPDKIVCTMKFTMSLGDWKQIRETLRSHTAFAEIQIINEINDLVDKLEKTLYAE